MGGVRDGLFKEMNMSKIFEDITKTIGRTPLVRINKLNKGSKSIILVKLNRSIRYPA